MCSGPTGRCYLHWINKMFQSHSSWWNCTLVWFSMWKTIYRSGKTFTRIGPSFSVERPWSDLRLKFFTGSGSIWSELKISCRSTSGAFPLALDSASKKLQVRDYPGIFAEILDRFWTGPTELTDQTTVNRKYNLTSTKIIFQYCYAAICETTVRVAEIVKQRLLSCSDDDDYQPNLVCAIGVIS